MSEEAVRQTRSQKRALEKEATPQSAENPDAENENKKPKLDPSEPTAEAQTKPKPNPALAQDDQSQISTGPEQDKEQDQNRSPLSLVLPLASQPVKDDQEMTVKPNSDSRTECNDKGSKVKTEQAMDTRSRARLTEPKASSGMLAAGEVKATIKVEVQTGEQPVDMSTSRG